MRIQHPLHIPFTLWTSLPPAEVLARLRLEPGVVEIATLWPDEQGTTVLGSMPAAEAEVLAPQLAARLEGEIELHEVVADPAADGAESAAPASLRAEILADGVRFTVPGPIVFGAWGASSTRTGVVVRATGLEIEVRRSKRAWPWGRVGGCALSRREGRVHLVLLDPAGAVVVGIPCAGSADDEWLAAYIDARARARNPSEDEREADERERERLGDLLGAARRED